MSARRGKRCRERGHMSDGHAAKVRQAEIRAQCVARRTLRGNTR
jgi:hypothetical protein